MSCCHKVRNRILLLYKKMYSLRKRYRKINYEVREKRSIPSMSKNSEQPMTHFGVLFHSPMRHSHVGPITPPIKKEREKERRKKNRQTENQEKERKKQLSRRQRTGEWKRTVCERLPGDKNGEKKKKENKEVRSVGWERLERRRGEKKKLWQQAVTSSGSRNAPLSHLPVQGAGSLLWDVP